MIGYFNAVVGPKLNCWENIPHSMVGAFGEYVGFDLSEAKDCVKRGFSEFAAVANKQSVGKLGFDYFGLETVVSLQLWEFCTSDFTRHLHDFEEAFITVQEQALGSVVGRVVEAEHKQIMSALQRGFTYSSPAMASARSRSGQILEMLESDAGMDFCCKRWNKSLASELLAHHKDRHLLNRMSFGKINSLVYQYSMEDLFPDTSVASANIDKLDAARANVSAKPDIPITPQAHMVVEYFKQRLAPNFYYSCNTVTWNQ